MGRIFGFVGVLISAGIVFYLYTKQAQSIASVGGGTSVQAAEVMTGVRGDLLGIANAERRYNATEGHYGSLEDLVSSHELPPKGDRPPFSYDIQTTGSGFRVTATRSGPGSPSEVWIDENMEIQSSN
ncbi:MAG: hypothetical protein AUG89_08390 [Acidobacteria bacterium 13_1_20CM_4_56_7]|jgi:hypothetical protein|nr:MAG: hypothetical protein AUG89_08390 [Acidobacteria bacterium 13_1_20CM_4_56_7]